jgi:hypothetical protein
MICSKPVWTSDHVIFIAGQVQHLECWVRELHLQTLTILDQARIAVEETQRLRDDSRAARTRRSSDNGAPPG